MSIDLPSHSSVFVSYIPFISVSFHLFGSIRYSTSKSYPNFIRHGKFTRQCTGTHPVSNIHSGPSDNQANNSSSIRADDTVILAPHSSPC